MTGKQWAFVVAENVILALLIMGAKNMQMAQIDLRLHTAQAQLAAQVTQTQTANTEIAQLDGQVRVCQAAVGRYQAFIQEATQKAQAQAGTNPRAAAWLPLLAALAKIAL